ncbi:putative DNA-directed RNA polymerase II subunit RPB4 [Monocercomonoides exilis]|uniref:putative DNA-directed RNA polymerase II subunit RPB4 n=1 Tax=Monocercomonoides exilis TaxID=2049356 RepID=UPI003559DB54|nr:putative DNA-directed RNA polymerase II subunit RPB4 [Monocercomonoides exilis]|eukprot:MONOS_1200.1-p1 / transcript=MONOS_1200.1 / gene=MONOS_1200 / organism=Monocercomonoides_exilis_PA203 / gene_product=unspecified product / transcript_product=unspecified product / location=Mono_scaffold00020:150605-151151(+) / protein_length=135 / sequence_SO=supercontig / SO=protein_coding / is_pseudo=false
MAITTESEDDDRIVDVSQCKLGPDFQDSMPLQYDHVLQLLLSVKDAQFGAQDPPEIFVKSFDHVQKFAQFKNASLAEELRRKLTDQGFHEYEQAQLANLTPETPEKARSLIPSLKRFDDDALIRVIQLMTVFRKG